MFQDRRRSSTGSGPALLAMFPFIVMFLVTSVTTLRERSCGTLERLLAMPMGKLDFLLGYALAFGVVAAVQAALAVTLSVGLLGLDVAGPGLAARRWSRSPTPCSAPRSACSVSAFARTEFQAVQFMPLFVIPQILLCGLFVPRERCPTCSSAISDVLPLSYAVDAMQTLTSARPRPASVWRGPGAWSSAFAVARPGARRGDPAPAYAPDAGASSRLEPSEPYGVACAACRCSANRCCCSPAAARSRSSSAPCRSRRGSSRSYVPGETTESTPSTPPPAWSTTACASPSTSSARTPSTPTRPTPPWRPTSSARPSSPRAA